MPDPEVITSIAAAERLTRSARVRKIIAALKWIAIFVLSPAVAYAITWTDSVAKKSETAELRLQQTKLLEELRATRAELEALHGLASQLVALRRDVVGLRAAVIATEPEPHRAQKLAAADAMMARFDRLVMQGDSAAGAAEALREVAVP